MTELLDSTSLLTVNNIIPNTRRKRISAELNLFINKFEFGNLSFTNDLDSLVLTIIDNNITPQFNTFSFVLPKEYPFRPPTVIINGQNYTSLLKFTTNCYQLCINHQIMYLINCRIIINQLKN